MPGISSGFPQLCFAVHDARSSGGVLAWVAFFTICFVWGTTYLAIAVAIETLPTFLFPGARFLLGGSILLVITLMRGERLPTARSDWANLALIGALMVGVGNLAVVWAEHFVPSGFAALLVATAPFWMAVLEALRREGERLTGRRLAGLVIGFAGVTILVAPELTLEGFNAKFLLGVLALQCGSIAWNIGSIRSKYHLSGKLSPLVSAALQMVFGGALMTAIGLARGEAPLFHFSSRSLAAFAYLATFGSVIAYGAYVYALAHLRTSTVSTYAYVNPLVAVVLGWLVLSEPIGWNALASMLVIFTGVALVQTMKRGGPPPAQVSTAVIKPVEGAEREEIIP